MLLDSRTFLPIPALPAGSSFSSLLSYYNRSSMFSFRINNRHHHHPRVPTGGDHHQSMSAGGPHMPLQGSRKPPSQHYGSSNGMAHGGGGMGSKHQHSGMGHPPKTLPYNSSSSSNSSSHQHQQQQHHHQQHNHHSHHSHPAGHHNSGSIPVVSAAGPGASKARMIPSHEREYQRF